MVGVALAYAALAAISVSFVMIDGLHLLLCLPVGMALAALLIFGIRYWPCILVGAFLSGLVKGYPSQTSLVLGGLLTLQTVSGVWLLKSVDFDTHMSRARDFFFLFLLAGLLASGITALGASKLLLFTTDKALNIWLSNTLGVSFVAPLILIWRQPFWLPPIRKNLLGLLKKKRAPEFFILLACSLVAGQIVFLNLFSDVIGLFSLEYIAFIFVVWAALRFGRHGVLFILGILLTQAMLSVKLGTGYFGQEILNGSLLNFSLYCTELLVIGMLLACVMRERNTSIAIAAGSEARLRSLSRLYQMLSHISQGSLRLENDTELFPFACRALVTHGDMKMAWVGVAHAPGHLLDPVACYGEEASFLDHITVHHGDHSGIRGSAAIAFRQNRSVVINHLSQHPNRARAAYAAAYHYQATASFPVHRAGKPYAVISVYSDRENAFDDEVVTLLKEMAGDLSFVLDNFDREHQRRFAEQAVLNSEQRFRAFFSRSMIGMATCAPEGQWLEVNDALCLMLGYERDELVKLTWNQITHPDDAPASNALLNRALRGKIDEFELDPRYIRKDGQIVYAHLAVRCLRKEDGSINYIACLIQDVTESKKSADLIWKQANFDQLTGLINRNLFHDRLQHAIKKSNRTRVPLALVYVDLDRFKEVNDTLGHAIGDTALVEAARRIESCIRASDTLARLGGDEFVIIIAQCPDRAPVNQIAQKIIERLGEPFLLGQKNIFITASIGIAFYPDDAADMESLLSHADQAMYASKNQGRSRLNYFTRSMREASQTRQVMVNDLRKALGANQFQLYFQPIVELPSNRIVKAEALLRWHHPTCGMIAPSHFIPIAEETGMIFNIGDWVFREAAAWAQRWQRYNKHGVQVSINKSPMQFMVQGADPVQLINHLHALNLPGHSIAIEITEGLLMHSEPAVMEKLLRFRDAGIQVAIDDFGTGYSALSYLNKFDIDYLKIDQSFIQNVVSDPYDKALSEAIIVMAHTLGLGVIAEGVETAAQRDFLAATGCDFAQGYLFSPPVTGAEFEAMLQ
ncbi:MAG: EAL domain-containing protein [Oxalobacter sp.]|nr:MAG: EAL domain-containing protein [Oxalobacter sp.]